MNYIKIYFFTLILLNSVYGAPATAKEQPKEVPHLPEKITLSYAPILKKVAPAVVNIYTALHSKAALPDSPLLKDPFFRQFFERVHPEYGPEQVALGSGVLINKEGFILTNCHVIEDADKIQVILSDKREFIAKIVSMDKRSDLALLKIESKEELPYLTVNAHENLEVGDVVLAIGNPFGVGQTVTHGIVSALSRSQEGISDFRSFIQTDAAINPGNSGGALVTTDGHLVGINTAIYSKSGGSVGIGFAIPTTLAIPVIESLKNGGRIIRPWIGLELEPITIQIAKDLGLNHPYGALVKNVYPKGPAHKAGLKAGDIITAIDGQTIEDEAALDYQVAISPLGKKTTIKILRQGKVKNIPIQLTEPMGAKDPQPFTIEGSNPLQGAKMRVLSPALVLEMGLNPMKSGIVVTEVEDEGTAIALGVLPGDVLVSVNKKNVDTKQDAITLLKNKENSWDLMIRRGEQLINFQIKA